MTKAAKAKNARSAKSKANQPNKASKKAKTGKAKATEGRQTKRSIKPVETIVPTYLQPPATIRIGLHDVIRALRMIEKQGHLNKLVSGSKREQLAVRVPAETVNFVKDFVVKHRMHGNQVGRHIVGGIGKPPSQVLAQENLAAAAGSGDINECDFGTVG